MDTAPANDPVKPSQCFRGKYILLTGTTGFVGKVVLEKLLRLHPDIGGIYLLIRSSKGYADARSRFEAEILSSSIFEPLRMKDGAQLQALCKGKLHFITGEVTHPRFGMAAEAFDALAQRLDAIINCAASVNFREALDVALDINALCLQTLAHLAKRGGNIPVLQVSTCYVGGFNSGPLYEENVVPAGKPIPAAANHYEVMPLIARLQNQISLLKQHYQGERLERKLVDLGIREAQRFGWNDTYTFTKWLGEQILRAMLAGSSLTIVRPSIIESTLTDPVPGWIEGVKVADAIILAYAREKVRFFPGKPDAVVDIIPADLVANSILLGLAEQFTLQQCARLPEHRVYQCCSGSSNPVTVGEVSRYVQEAGELSYQKFDRLFLRKPRYPFVTVPRPLFDAVMKGIRLPLGWVSRLQRLAGLRLAARSLDNLETTLNLATVFSFYMAPTYIFHNARLLALWARVDPEEASHYRVDARQIHWRQYLQETHLAGLNRYVLKARKSATKELRSEQDTQAADHAQSEEKVA